MHSQFPRFLVYQYTALSSRAVDRHQMYSGGLVVGKASTIGIEISPTLPLIFTGGGAKSAKFGVVFNIPRESRNFEPPVLKMQQDIHTLRQSSCPAISPPSLCCGLHAPLRTRCQLCPTS